MPDWEALRHFNALVHEGTLAGAARLLDVEHATVARRVAALERELGLKLVDRRGRKIEITADGREVAEFLRVMQANALAIERIAAGKRKEIAGEVTISAPPALGTAVLAEPLVELRAREPMLSLRIVAETRRSSLGGRESDLAIRLSRPEEGDLTATKLGEVLFHFYASPQYLAERDTADWSFIGFDAPMDSAPHQITLKKLAAGRPVAVRASSAEMQLALALAGGGIAILPDFLVPPDRLAIVGEERVRREVWMLVHSDMAGSAPVRAVADALRNGVRRTLARWT